jgi:hypothetical protein
MEATHQFNEYTKQLDPKETSCFFCGSHHSASQRTNVSFKLYRENDRTNLLVYRSVKFKMISIGVPRCATCKKIHHDAGLTGTLASLALTAIIIALSIAAFGAYGMWAVIPAIFAGVFFFRYVERTRVEAKGIARELVGAEQDPLVAAFLADGWSGTRPSA